MEFPVKLGNGQVDVREYVARIHHKPEAREWNDPTAMHYAALIRQQQAGRPATPAQPQMSEQERVWVQAHDFIRTVDQQVAAISRQLTADLHAAQNGPVSIPAGVPISRAQEFIVNTRARLKREARERAQQAQAQLHYQIEEAQQALASERDQRGASRRITDPQQEYVRLNLLNQEVDRRIRPVLDRYQNPGQFVAALNQLMAHAVREQNRPLYEALMEYVPQEIARRNDRTTDGGAHTGLWDGTLQVLPSLMRKGLEPLMTGSEVAALDDDAQSETALRNAQFNIEALRREVRGEYNIETPTARQVVDVVGPDGEVTNIRQRLDERDMAPVFSPPGPTQRTPTVPIGTRDSVNGGS